MVQINFALKEVNCKIVYYGPGLSGKTTNLEVVHAKAPSTHVGELTSIATEGDRTLFFDFLPLNLGQVAGMNTKFQIYTVPGQVYYNSTRKLVLQGADGIVFVADSRKGKMDENLESLGNLEENLREYGMDLQTIPLVIQYNKRDLADIYSIEELQSKLNKCEAPYFEAVAVTGEGVFPTLKKLSGMVLESLNRQQGSTAVRRPPKERSQEPVAVGVGAGKARAGAAAGPAPARPGSKKSGPERRGKGPGPVEERVEVERPAPRHAPRPASTPPAPPARPSTGPITVVKKKPSVRIPQAQTAPRRKGRRVVIIVAVLIVVWAAAIYLSGVWKQFL
jgi:mutual gliding-motility protein MglA